MASSSRCPPGSQFPRFQLPTHSAPGRRRRFFPFLLPRGEPQVANPTNLAICLCKITHKDLPFAPAPPVRGPPARVTKCPSSLPGLFTSGTRTGALFSFLRPKEGPWESEAWNPLYPGPSLPFYNSLHQGVKMKLNLGKGGELPLRANTVTQHPKYKHRSRQKSRHLPGALDRLAKIPRVLHAESAAGAKKKKERKKKPRTPLPLTPQNPCPAFKPPSSGWADRAHPGSRLPRLTTKKE